MSKPISRVLTILGIMTGLASTAPGPLLPQQNVPVPTKPAAKPAPQDLPDREQDHSPQATSSVCPQPTHVHNLTKSDVKLIYSWAGPHSDIYKVKKGETVALPDTDCITKLSVVTKGKAFSVDVKPGQDYDLIWSVEKKAYQLRETTAK